MNTLRDNANDSKARTTISVVDCQYEAPQFAASFILQNSGDVAIIEQNTSKAVPLILTRLAALGLDPSQVKYVIPTHIHLDHVGGAGTLLAHCPNAQVLCHPRAERHLIDPSKLSAAVRAVYGDKEFDRLYGRMDPIPAGRVRSVEDQTSVGLGNDKLTFWHTRGHANHHICVISEKAAAIFTGDSFGLAYPCLQTNGLFGIASTSPSDFDAGEAEKTVQRILDWAHSLDQTKVSPSAYLTHFGAYSDFDSLASQIRADIQWSAQEVERMGTELRSGKLTPSDANAAQQRLVTTLYDRWKTRFASGRSLNSECLELFFRTLKLDCELNAQGLWVAALKAAGPT